jgi:hypothetical protein
MLNAVGLTESGDTMSAIDMGYGPEASKCHQKRTRIRK